MIQYAPDYFQWLTIVTLPLLCLVLLFIGAALVLYTLFKKMKDEKASTLFGVIGAVLVLLGVILPVTVSTDNLNENIAKSLTENAKLEDVKLLHVSTTGKTASTTPSVSFIGTAKDTNGDPRQFSYTQYESFGVYEMIGFDKPAVDLKDQSFKFTEDSVDELKSGDNNNTETEAPKVTEEKPEVKDVDKAAPKTDSETKDAPKPSESAKD